MDKQLLGKLIRSNRTQQNISIRKFAQMCNVSTTQIQVIETGQERSNPQTQTIEKIIKGLNLSQLEQNRIRQAAGFVIPVDDKNRQSLSNRETAMLDKIRQLPEPFVYELDRMLDGWLRAFDQER